MKSFTKIFIFISIVLSLTSFASTVHAATLTVNSTSTISSDTISGYSDVTIDAAGADITITFDDAGGELNGANWLFDDSVGGGSITVSGDLETDGNISVDTTVTHAQGDVDGVQFETSGNITITANGSIDVSSKGCRGTSGSHGFYHDIESNSCSVSTADGADQGGGKGSKGGGGGANGGDGGNGRTVTSTAGWGGTAYSEDDVFSSTDPNANILTLGGGGGKENNRAGGAGGGIISLIANTLTINGSLTASGQGGGYAVGTGAGGTIFMQATTLDIPDASTVTANGSNSSYTGNDRAGAGGGGRIIAFYSTDSQSTTGDFTASNNAAGGTNSQYANQNASNGTVHMIEYTVPNTTSFSTGITDGQYNLSLNPTIEMASYSANGLSQLSLVLNIYSDNLLSNLVATCSVNSGNSITVNSTNCVDGDDNAYSALSSYTKYYFNAYYTNGKGAGTASTSKAATTLFSGSGSTKTWDFDEATPGNFYEYDTDLVVVNPSSNSNAQLVDLGSSTYAAALNKVGNDTFTKSKSISITNSTGYAITDGNIRLDITYDADMQADFGDLRYVDSSGNVLKYWIQNKTDSTSAVVWIKIPNIPTGSSSVTMLYGNGSVSSLSNGDDTFLMFEDFNGLADDFTELSDWSVNGNAQSKWDLLNDRLEIRHGNGSSWNRSMLSNTVYTRPANASYNLYLQNKMYWTTDISNYDAIYPLMFKDSDGGITGCNDCIYGIYNKGRDGHSGFIDRETGWLEYSNHISVQTWYYHNIEMTSTGGVGAYSTDGSDWTSFTSSSYTGIDDTQLAILQHSGNYYIDDFFLAKKANVSHTIGSEGTAYSFADVQIKPKLNNGVSLGTPYQLSHSTSGGSVLYNLLIDLNKDGDTADANEGLYYHDGTEWTAVTTPSAENNTIDEINLWIGDFTSDVGEGNIYPVAYLVSDGSEQVEVDSITMKYGASKATVNIACDSNVTEGGTVTCTASLSAAVDGGNGTVQYTTTNGTALSGSDYTATSGTLTFSNGSSASQTFTVSTTNDSLDEPTTETVNISISNPNDYLQLGTDTTSFTITDNDDQPSIAIADQNVTENGGTQTVNVTLTGASQSTITVNYSTADGTASAGTDYTSASGTLTWTSGQTGNKTISIPVADNLVDNPNKTLAVNLASASNASISDANGTITITDNESTPAITINDPSANEGNNVSFTISMSPASSQDVTVDYTTANGTATAGNDYTTKSGTATIGAGSTSTVIAVSTSDDNTAEGAETILMNLSNASNATISDSQGQGTINDNDLPTLAIADVTEDEDAGTMTFTVTMTGQHADDVTVDYATAGSTATSNTDFTAASGTLTWTAGQTGAKTFTVTIANDSLDENDETFAVNLSNASNATISDSQATGTITDDDASPSVSIALDDTSIEEGESATLTATLSAVSGRDVTVNLTHSGTATTSDINQPSSVTISAGDLTGTYTAAAIDDDLDENNETNVIDVSSISGATDLSSAVTLTITDNDTAGVTVTQTGGTTAVTEGTGNDAFTVVLDTEPTDDVVFTLASDNDEITLSVSELTFTSENWETPQTVTVTAVDDDFDEDSPHSDSVTFSVASDSDSLYDAFTVTAVSVAITDNDSAGIVVTQTGGGNSVTEGGATDTFTVVLNTAPVDDVVLDLTTTPSGQISVSPTSLTFTDANFDTPQTVTITATDNRVPEDTALAGVNFTKTTLDSNYDALSVSSQSVTVVDNDSAWVTIAEVDEDEALTEDGDTKQYSIVLNAQPDSAVTVRVQADSESSVDVTLFTFRPQNAHAKAWNKLQYFTVTATDDNDDEGDHNTVIQYQIAGDDEYNGLSIPSTTAAITDNDGEEEVEEEEGEGSSTSGSSTSGSTTSGSSTSGSTTSGSTTSGSNTSGSSTSGSTTNGSTTSGSSTSGSTTSGSSTSGSSTSGSTTSGSTTGNNRPERQIEILTLSAGTDRVVRPGKTVYLYGSITKSPSGSHTWQWAQTAGQSVELEGVNRKRLEFTAPANFEGSETTLTFKLTATTNASQKEDSVSVTVRKKIDMCLGNSCNDDNNDAVTPPKGPECEVIGMTSDGKAICKDNNNNSNNSNSNNDCPAGTIESMSIGGQRICNPFTKQPEIQPIGTLVAIGYPFANRGRGKVVIYETETASQKVIDPLNEFIDEDPDVLVLEGSQTGDLFGHQIKVCDFNGDGQKDIYITAPNTRKGTGYMVEIYRDGGNELSAATTGVISGGQHPLRTKFMQCLNYDGNGGDEIFLPVKLEGNSSRSANNNLSFSVSGADINDDGQLVFASESEVDDSNVAESSSAFNGLLDSTATGSSLIDFSVTNPDTTIDTDVDIDAMSSGDLNGDGYDDLVLASTETCDVYVYFGQESMESEISTYNEIACQEGSNFEDLVIGDVNGDGIDDLILVFPDDGGDGGSIFILPGMNGNDISTDSGYTIYGSADNPITGIVLADTDGDGDSELVVNNGSGGTTIIGGDGSVLDTGSGTGATTLGGGGVSTGCQLSADHNSQAASLYWIVIMLSLSTLIIARKKQKQE